MGANGTGVRVLTDNPFEDGSPRGSRTAQDDDLR